MSTFARFALIAAGCALLPLGVGCTGDAKSGASARLTLAQQLEALKNVDPADDDSPAAVRARAKKCIEGVDRLTADPEATDGLKYDAAHLKLVELIHAAESLPDEFLAPCQEYAGQIAARYSGRLGDTAALVPLYFEVSRSPTLPPNAVTRLTEMTAKHPLSEMLPPAYELVAERLASAGRTTEGAELLTQGRKHFRSSDVFFDAHEFNAQILRMTFAGQPLEIVEHTVDGQPFDLKSLRGKVVLVDFWATWCGPCLAVLPEVKKVYEQHHANGFEVVGISLDEDAAELKSFTKDEHMPWVQLISPNEAARRWDAPLVKKFGVHRIPVMYLLDREGKFITDDLHTPERLAAAVEKAMKQQGPVVKE